MGKADELVGKMLAMRNDTQTQTLMRFFKCGEGEYGHGDKFLGLRVPDTRALVKEFRRETSLHDTLQLVTSPWHEVRLAGFLLMIELYKRDRRRAYVQAYLSMIGQANNWDLVDLSAPYLLGDWLVDHPEERPILYDLARMDGKLWHQRVAMVANWMLIRHGEYASTFDIAQMYVEHPHDLIHKATGWMLREVGKRGGETQLREFLDRNATLMPRTMLRYAIERFPEHLRRHYLNLK